MTTLEEAAAHWREWFDRGEFDEGAARVDEALNAPGAAAPSADRVRVLYGAHLLAFRRGKPSAVYARECLDLARELGDVRGDESRKQQEFHNLGWVELHGGEVDAAERMFAERDARSGLDAMGDAWTQLNHAAVALARGGREEATRLFEAGRRQLEELGATLDPDDQFEFDWLSAELART